MNAPVRRPTTPATCSSIEDEPQMRSMLIDNLEFEGYRVTAVASGEEALQTSPAASSSRCCWST